MIEQIKFEEIQKYREHLKNSDLVFCKNTILYGLYIKPLGCSEKQLVGFSGILKYKNKVVFKNSFVFQKYRGKGYFKQLFDFSLKITKQLGIKIVEATCTYMIIEYYLKNGFSVIKKYKHFTKVRNENIQ